jgi:type IV secretory pathway VirB4 component
MPRSTAATQEFVAIRDIRDGVVILKNGQLRAVLLASSINFALKSQDEQHAILLQFQTFLNTLDFSLQIYVQSRRMNVEPYLARLMEREPHQDNDLMRIQLREYINFVRAFTTEVEVMSKNFFVVVPYGSAVIDIKKGITDFLTQGSAPLVSDTRFEEQRIQLEQRISLVEQSLHQIGVHTVPLKNDELVELFYHIYNPTDPTGSAPVIEKAA